jgi:predicted GIY-YIG superfamily endonuclease
MKQFTSAVEEQIYLDRVARAQKGDRAAQTALINFHAMRGEDAEGAHWLSVHSPCLDWAAERERVSKLQYRGDSSIPTTSKQGGFVYVIQDIQSGLYKIGITTNMPRRMQELGVGKTARLLQQKQVTNPRAVEKAAHERYRAARLPQTEYFKLTSPPSV